MQHWMNQEKQIEETQRRADSLSGLSVLAREDNGSYRKFKLPLDPMPPCEGAVPFSLSPIESEIELAVATLRPSFDWLRGTLNILYAGPYTLTNKLAESRRFLKYRIRNGQIELVDVVSARRMKDFDLIIICGPQESDAVHLTDRRH